MPRSTQEIIESADELEGKLEAMQPHEPGSAALAAVHRAVIARARCEADLAAAVAAARAQGQSWARIGAYLGTSGEAARQKYRHLACAEGA